MLSVNRQFSRHVQCPLSSHALALAVIPPKPNLNLTLHPAENMLFAQHFPWYATC
jgi:hypothetical protein